MYNAKKSTVHTVILHMFKSMEDQVKTSKGSDAIIV